MRCVRVTDRIDALHACMTGLIDVLFEMQLLIVNQADQW
jgi:hypothetical protein